MPTLQNANRDGRQLLRRRTQTIRNSTEDDPLKNTHPNHRTPAFSIGTAPRVKRSHEDNQILRPHQNSNCPQRLSQQQDQRRLQSQQNRWHLPQMIISHLFTIITKMLRKARLFYPFSLTKNTRFINYTPGGPENMFIDQRNL